MKRFLKQEIGEGDDGMIRRKMSAPSVDLSLASKHYYEQVTEDKGNCRKRKSHHLSNTSSATETITQQSLDLQLISDPLPLDWEQCLDLQTGTMYYLNRKTLRKSLERPSNDSVHKLDLDLNISTSSSDDSNCYSNKRFEASRDNEPSNGRGTMVALACSNCHLLVILSKSSPSCPNCKYVHPLQSNQPPPTPLPPPDHKARESVKSLNTLSLLN